MSSINHPQGKLLCIECHSVCAYNTSEQLVCTECKTIQRNTRPKCTCICNCDASKPKVVTTLLPPRAPTRKRRTRKVKTSLKPTKTVRVTRPRKYRQTKTRRNRKVKPTISNLDLNALEQYAMDLPLPTPEPKIPSVVSVLLDTPDGLFEFGSLIEELSLERAVMFKLHKLYNLLDEKQFDKIYTAFIDPDVLKVFRDKTLTSKYPNVLPLILSHTS